MAETPNATPAEFTLDLDRKKQIVDVGIRRASAFLKIGLTAADAEPPTDFALAGGIAFRFFPTPVKSDVAREVRDEFSSWLIGSCLRELDQYFSLYLDALWELLELSEFHGAVVNSSEVIALDQSFSGRTNVSTKLRDIAERIQTKVAADCFHSLSLARNALSHGAGRVRRRDTNVGSALEVRWIAPVIVIQDGDQETIIREAIPADGYKVRSPDGARLLARIEQHSEAFPLGSKIDLSAHNLAEICFFYSQQASLVLQGVSDHLLSKGILPKAQKASSL